MFNEVKSMMRISGDDDDDAIILNIKAAALDLTRTADIVLPGSIDISRVNNWIIIIIIIYILNIRYIIFYIHFIFII